MYLKISFSLYNYAGSTRISCRAQFSVLLTISCLSGRSNRTCKCVGAKPGLRFQSFPINSFLLLTLLCFKCRPSLWCQSQLHMQHLGMMPSVEEETNDTYCTMVFCELCRNTLKFEKSAVLPSLILRAEIEN